MRIRLCVSATRSSRLASISERRSVMRPSWRDGRAKSTAGLDLRQNALEIGLEERLRQSWQSLVGVSGQLGVAGGEDHRQGWLLGARGRDELDTGHVGHGLVGDHQIE